MVQPTVRLLSLRAIAAIATLLLTWPALSPPPPAHAQPVHTITWDSHSLFLDGQRLFLYSGEVQYFRLPSVAAWRDRLEKIKAAGLNAVSLYFDWQYHSSAPGSYDFTGPRDVDRLLSIADQLGLYVIARVGPYINAEVDAGGLPGWVLDQQLYPRSQTWNGTQGAAQYSPLFSQDAEEWYGHLLPILARHQVTNGGSVIMVAIENEYDQTIGSAQYMQDLYSTARADGITVPIFHNDFYFRGDWDKLVDLYAFDSYPYGFQCCHQWWDMHFHGVDTWETQLRQKLGIQTPMFVAELQGGSFDPWGGVGYAKVAATLNGDWLNALDQSAFAQGATILNTYMFAGGTSWGYMSDPSTYTSYDYGAPISEAGVLRPAYYAAHRLALFLQAYGGTLAGADAAPSAASVTNTQVVVHSRVDAASGTAFIFLRHGDAGKPVQTSLRLTVPGFSGTVPQHPHSAITLPGHGAQLLLADRTVGPLHLNYTTSSVLTQATTAEGPYLVLYGPAGSSGETDFTLPAGPLEITHNPGVQVTKTAGQLRLNYQHGADPRLIRIQTATGTLRILVTDAWAAGHDWLDNGLLITGPDLVEDDGSLSIQNSQPRDVRIFGAAPNSIMTVSGAISASPDAFMGMIDLGTLSGAPKVALPKLASWRFEAEAPEIQPGFDDSGWTPADRTSTANPNVPQGPSLLADDYGFHYGFVWYRGHFISNGAESGISLEARQSYAVFLNGRQIGQGDTSLADPPHPYGSVHFYRFPSGLLRPGQDNVVAVLTESLGHDEGWLAGPVAQSPQGILSASLVGGTAPIAWRIQGDLGGEHPADTLRGLQNASGLYGERSGWYLPSFDDASWAPVALPDNWKKRGVTSPIGWYRTHFSLSAPSDVNAPIGLVIPHASDKAVIWLNGWLIGRYWEQKGPQHEFYLPEGLLNTNGDNVLAVAVWNRGHMGGLTSAPRLVQYTSLRAQTVSISSAEPDNGYWHTDGNRIVDAEGRPVRIAAVNWFGMEDHFFVPAGLDKQPLDAIMQRVHDLGFNAIRLPFSNQGIEQNPVLTTHLAANPDLQGLHYLDLMDRIVASAGAHGLRIILDNARDEAGTQPSPNGLWYDAAYPESHWIADWQFLARRYLNNPTVVAFDLHNEPHTAPPGPWSVQAYLHQGATWGPYDGHEDAATDWRLAAERGGDAVLAVNPHLLIMVEGLQLYPDPSRPAGIDSYWWGGILTPAARYPVQLDVPDQMVYSPHEYGPFKYPMSFFGPHMSYNSIVSVWEKHWAYLEAASNRSPVPIVIGEFGTCGSSPSCVSDTRPGSQGLWFSYLVRFLRAHPEIGWSFWALNGTSHMSDPTPNYVLRPDWQSLRLPALTETFRDLEFAPPPG